MKIAEQNSCLSYFTRMSPHRGDALGFKPSASRRHGVFYCFAIKNVECTSNELYGHWLSHGWDDVYDFPTYKRLCQQQGTKIVEEKNNGATDE